MDALRYARVKELFERLLDVPEAARDALLSKECGGDDALRAEVVGLLRHASASSRFLASPPAVPEDEPLDPPPSALRIPGFALQHVLGKGGMGIVYLARQESPEREVAVKCLRLALFSRRERERFEREARILGVLNHPGIAQVFDAGTTETEQGDLPWIAMEYVRGKPLTAARVGGGWRARAELLAALCDAVEHAHAHGIVHRDLKPSNVLVDEHGRVKVLDFGVARLADERRETVLRTRTGQLLGTLAYMSPEQARGAAEVDARSDVYALGVLGFELLTGRLPYEVEEDDLLGSIKTICDEPPERLRRARREMPADLETVLLKALAKEAGRRYGTAGELAADLRRALAEEPVRARRPTKLYQAAKFVRRHRAVSTSAAAVMLAQSVMVVLLVAQRGQLTEKNETTNAMLITLARALVEAAPIMGFGEDQRASLESVEEALEPQVAGNLEDRSLAQSYAEVLYALAGLDQAVADLVHARARFERARAVLEELAVDEPGVAARVRLADVYAKLGELARDEGDEGGMDVWFQRALALHEELVREHPGDGELLEDLAWSLHRAARVALQRGSLEEAKALQERRMLDARALAERDPDNWKFLHNLAQAHMLGGEIVEREDPGAAVAHRREALRLAEELCAMQPRRRDFQAQWVRAMVVVARIEQREGDLVSASEHFARAHRHALIVFMNDPTPADNQRLLYEAAAGWASLLARTDLPSARAVLADVRGAASMPGAEGFDLSLMSAGAALVEAALARRGGVSEVDELEQEAYRTLLDAIERFPVEEGHVHGIARLVRLGSAARREEFLADFRALAPTRAREVDELLAARHDRPSVADSVDR